MVRTFTILYSKDSSFHFYHSTERSVAVTYLETVWDVGATGVNFNALPCIWHFTLCARNAERKSFHKNHQVRFFSRRSFIAHHSKRLHTRIPQSGQGALVLCIVLSRSVSLTCLLGLNSVRHIGQLAVAGLTLKLDCRQLAQNLCKNVCS